MKFNIKEIGLEGRTFARTLDPARVHHLLQQAGVESVSSDRCAVAFQLEVRPIEGALVVRGSISGTFQLTCGRCLGLATITVDDPDLRLTYLPRAETEPVEEEQLSLEDLDTYTFSGEEIDLEPLVREQLVLAIPMAPQCKDDCKGLCSGCGADLNLKACDCSASVAPTTPWKEAISQIKENKADS